MMYIYIFASILLYRSFFHHIFRSFSRNLSLVSSMNLMVLFGYALDHFLSGFECNPLMLKLLEGSIMACLVWIHRINGGLAQEESCRLWLQYGVMNTLV